MATSPEYWAQLKELFRAAIEYEPRHRAAFLDQACAGDSALRAEIESLLTSHDHAENFIETPAFADAIQAITETTAEQIEGQRVGSYQLLREIGRGGMGTVYLAHRADEQYQKLVAIKVVRRGMDTKDILRRFRNERQILASLEHPNIARLLDGGTTGDGTPYFVMEYVEGTPVTDYCDHHRLTTTERLQLFRTVCAAVQYAHQNLIVHRDLKPSNILITPDGTSKLLDFGIAKLLSPELSADTAEHTLTELRILTPDYASPEQVRGEKLTTTSDIYSLGVVLYELLTGHRPYHAKGAAPHELARVICEQEPAKPSTAINSIEVIKHGDAKSSTTITPEAVSRARDTQPDKLCRSLSGDLDNIILMAMRKEPARRYSSVSQFSEDIARHISGLPVIARKDTFTYRSQKFIQRNKLGVAAAALIALSLLVGMTLSVWQMRKAHVEAAKAARVSAFMQNIFLLANQRFNSPGRNLKGSKMTAVDMLDEASKRIDTELADQPDVRAQLHHTVGDTYLTFNRYDTAEQHFRLALALSREVYGERNPKVANELYHLAATLDHKDESSEADKLYRQAIAMMRQTDAENANLPHMLTDYAGTHLQEYGDVETAEPLFRESLALFRRKYGEEYLMVVLLNDDLAEVALARNELDKAEAMYRDSLAGYGRLPASTDQNTHQFINRTNVYLARVVLKKGHYAEAETILRGVLDRADESSPDDDALTLSCDSLLAQLHYRTGEYDKAEAEVRRELEIEQSIFRADHRGMIEPLCQLSEVLSKEGKTKEAASRYDEARQIYDRRAGDDFKDAYLKGVLGECLTVQGRYNEAEPLLTESYTALNSRLGQSNSLTMEAKRRLLILYEAWHKPEQAAQYRALL
jgi:serine/threonine protein kinase/predicted negative regulator of RcsB-dependent stress response